MTAPQVLAQCTAILIIIIMSVGAHAKEQKTFLIYQIVINSLYVAHYALLAATTAVATSVICVVRTAVFFLYQRKGREVPAWLIGVIFVVVVGVGAAAWRNWLSIFPIIATIIYTYGQWQHNVQTARKAVIAGDGCWIVYNIFYFGYVNFAGKIVEIISCAIAMRRYSKGKEG